MMSMGMLSEYPGTVFRSHHRWTDLLLRQIWNPGPSGDLLGVIIWTWVDYFRVPGLAPKSKTATVTQSIGAENVAQT